MVHYYAGSFIDTDLSDRHFVNCTASNTGISRLLGSCDEDFEFNIYADTLWRANACSAALSMLAAVLAGQLLQHIDKTRAALVFALAALALTVVFGMVAHQRYVVWLGAAIQACVYAAMAAVILLAAETYETTLR